MSYIDLFDGGKMSIQKSYHNNGSIKSIGYYLQCNPLRLKNNELMFGILHREDGPAHQAFTTNGKLIRDEYWQYDLHHREDGPAIILYTTSGRVRKVDWFYKGNCVNDLVKDWMKNHGIRWYRMTPDQKNLFKIQMLEKLRKLYG